MFADDTTILTTGSSVQSVERNLNQLAAEVSAWANINRMALNATKTKSMLVSSPQKLNTLSSQSLNVAVNDSKVEQVTEAKVLGVTFDHTLSWEGHVETLCKKLNSRITLLRRIQPYLTQVGSLPLPISKNFAVLHAVSCFTAIAISPNRPSLLRYIFCNYVN